MTPPTLDQVKIHATSRPHDDQTAEPHRWTVEGNNQAELMAEVRAAVPDGWDLLHVIVDRD